jgi:hypothetical protein
MSRFLGERTQGVCLIGQNAPGDAQKCVVIGGSRAVIGGRCRMRRFSHA